MDVTDKMKRQSISVNEIFGPTFQGEGRYAGTYPCAFLRLAYCNLSCIWCDTPFTWNWTGTTFEHPEKYDPAKEIHNMTYAEVLDKIVAIEARHLVVSGGEPLLQQHRLIPILRMLRDMSWLIEVETNGTIAPTKELNEVVHSYNCSPKLSNSKDSIRRRLLPRVLEKLVENPNVDFKFVLSDKLEIDEVEAFMTLFEIPKDRVYIMPMGKTPEELHRSRMVRHLAQHRGFNYSPRLQIEKYGNKRAV